MTISEIQNEAKALEAKIKKLAEAFEDKTGTMVTIHCSRNWERGQMTSVVSSTVPRLAVKEVQDCPF